MDYTIKELSQHPENTLCERQLRRRCSNLHPKYPNKIKRTSNRMWLISDEVSDEVIKRRNNRLMDSQLINSGKEILESEYLVLKETLDEIRQEYDKVEWMFFAGFRPKYNIGVPILFNMVKSIAEELKLRTKSNVVVFYAIEKSNDGIYHVHLALKGSISVKRVFPDILRYKFGKIVMLPMIKNFDDEYQSECFRYLSKEYFVDVKMRIGIIKR